MKLLILVKLNSTVQKMTTLTHWSKVPQKVIVLGLGKPYGTYYQKSLKSRRTCCIIFQGEILELQSAQDDLGHPWTV